jgi:hypothetical protein
MRTATATTEDPVGTSDAFYVYGIVPADASLEEIEASAGMGSGVRLVTEGAVGALVETIDPEQPLGRRKDLLAHSTVLNAMAAQGPVLPMRFGSVVADEEAVVEELLRPQHDHFAEMLEGVRGKVQLNLRARYELDTVLAEIVQNRPDIAELRERTADLPEDATHYDRIRLGELVAHEVDERRSRDSGRILDQLVQHAEDYLVREVSGMDNLAELSFLVAEEDVAAFEDAAESVAEQFAGRARINLVGPMALYDFLPE